MFTANSMNCLSEAIGLGLPGNGTVLADNPERKKLWRKAGKRIVEMVKEDLKPRDIVTREALDNAFALDMAMGGSTNTVLHALAIAHEAGVAYDLDRINELSKKCPNICKVSPSSPYHMEDVDRAGGISAILKEISKVPGLLNTDCEDRHRQDARQEHRARRRSRTSIASGRWTNRTARKAGCSSCAATSRRTAR